MNIAFLLETVHAIHPQRVAVVDAGGALTYTKLQARARRWGAWLRAETQGRPTLYLGQSNCRLVELMFGAAVAGSPFVPVNYRVKRTELERFVDASRPAVVFTEERYRSTLAAANATLISSDFVPPTLDPVEPSFDATLPAIKLFTSGTTSSPKLVSLTHANLSSYVLDTVIAGSAGEGEAALLSTPSYHIAAVANILSNVFRGRRLVLLERFDALNWLETVQIEEITHAMVVPTMLARILEVLETRPDLSPRSLKGLAYGGSKAPDGLVEKALELLPGHVGLVNAYGLTETSSTVALLGPNDHREAWMSSDPPVRARLRSVGRALPSIEIKAVRADCSTAPVGATGELWVRGGQIRGDDDGWLRTGDEGYVDADGYIFVLGRRDDVIIRGGENIAPQEIEDALRSHPAVEDALAVGVPDPEWGQVIGAVVTALKEVDGPELQDWVRSRLAGYKVPTAIKQVEEIPRNDLGKVVRRQALKLFLS